MPKIALASILLAALLATLLLLPAEARAGTVQVDQTGPDSFVVSFEKLTRPGGIEGAMRGAKRHASALCKAAGYAWYRVLDREARKAKASLLPTAGHTAAVEVQFLDSPDAEEGESVAERCTGTKKELRKMEKWLRTLDYQRPEPEKGDPVTPEDG